MTVSFAPSRPPESAPSARTPVAAWISILWALLHTVLAMAHWFGSGPAPWSPAAATVLEPMAPATVTIGIVVLSVVSLLALAAGAAFPRPAARTSGIVLVTTGLAVALVVADTRALAMLGYLPMLLLGLTGLGPVPPDFDWSGMLHSALALSHVVGGLAVVLTGAAMLEASRPRPESPTVSQGAAALRVGRVAVAIAAVIPLGYAVTRLAWTAGVPLGLSRESLEMLGEARWAGFGLGLFALVGSLLTLGLVQRWGEVFWGWVPLIGGRHVPPGMAVWPALLVATAVTSAGLGFVSLLLRGDLAALPGTLEDWGAWAPEMVWPVWGLALGTAAVAYRIRRRSGFSISS